MVCYVLIAYVLIAYVLIVIFGFSRSERAHFALRGTDLIWTRWVVNNAVVCQVYHSSAVTATAKILERFMKVTNHIWMAWTRLSTSAISLLLQMRDLTFPLGQLIAHYLKSAGVIVEKGLRKNTRKRYNLNYNKITQEAQRNQVAIDTVESSERANSSETCVVKCARVVLKVWTIINIWISLYLIGMAEEWQAMLGFQVES